MKTDSYAKPAPNSCLKALHLVSISLKLTGDSGKKFRFLKEGLNMLQS